MAELGVRSPSPFIHSVEHASASHTCTHSCTGSSLDALLPLDLNSLLVKRSGAPRSPVSHTLPFHILTRRPLRTSDGSIHDSGDAFSDVRAPRLVWPAAAASAAENAWQACSRHAGTTHPPGCLRTRLGISQYDPRMLACDYRRRACRGVCQTRATARLLSRSSDDRLARASPSHLRMRLIPPFAHAWPYPPSLFHTAVLNLDPPNLRKL